MSSVATAVVGSAVVGGYFSNKAAGKQSEAADRAAQLQADVTREQLAQQKDMYDANNKRMQPFVDAGKDSLAQLQSGMAPGGQFMQKFNGANFQQDPSYQWRLQQGLKAVQNSGAAKGTAMTGQGLVDINNYAQGAASQEYQNAYSRFNDTQSLLFNRLRAMAGDSQNAAAGMGTAGTQVSSNMAQTAMTGANNQGNLITQAGNAQAAGIMGTSNAITGGISTGLNAYMQKQYLDKLPTPAPAAVPGTATP